MLKRQVWVGIDAGYAMPGLSVAEVICEEGVWKPGKFIHAEGFICEAKSTKEKLLALKKLPQTQQDVIIVRDTTRAILQLIRRWCPRHIVCELPTGGAKSSSAIKGMAMATAMTTAIVEAGLHLEGVSEYEICMITPMQNKKGSTGVKVWKGGEYDHDKWLLWEAVDKAWPGIPWPMKKRKSLRHLKDEGPCWAMSDALSCILTRIGQLNTRAKV